MTCIYDCGMIVIYENLEWCTSVWWKKTCLSTRRLVLHFYNFTFIFCLEFGFVLHNACCSFFFKSNFKVISNQVFANGSSTRTMFIDIMCWWNFSLYNVFCEVNIPFNYTIHLMYIYSFRLYYTFWCTYTSLRIFLWMNNFVSFLSIL